MNARRFIWAPALIAVAALLLAAATRSSDASAQEQPQAFVDALSCAPDTRSVSAFFVVPGRTETRVAADQRIDQVWIDLSLFNNDFRVGTFLGFGPYQLRPDDGYIVAWGGLIPSRTHYYRLNALVGGRWIELGRGAFETPSCALVKAIVCPFNSKGVPPNERAFASFAVPGAAVIPDGPDPLQSWLDLSLFQNGFAAGTFLGAGPLDPRSSSDFQWEGLIAARRHFIRVNTLYDSGRWMSTMGESFVTLECRGRPTIVPPAI